MTTQHIMWWVHWREEPGHARLQTKGVTSFMDAVQMGGPEGVRASEQYTLVIGLANGMSMHAVPRPGVMEGPSINGHAIC